MSEHIDEQQTIADRLSAVRSQVAAKKAAEAETAAAERQADTENKRRKIAELRKSQDAETPSLCVPPQPGALGEYIPPW